MRRLPVLLAVVIGLLVSACAPQEAPDGRVQVVTTTAILGDFARQVSGPDADVTVIIPPGVDIHSFEPTPAVARAVATADLIVLNGYHLEEGVLGIVAQNRRADGAVVIAARGLAPRGAVEEHAGDGPEPEGLGVLATAAGDPHLWLSVAGARRYVENIRDGLVAADPAHTDGYRERAARYIDTLAALDIEVRQAVEQIPPERRRLVVFHDAYGYFADAYGFELTASLLPGGANQQVSAQKVVEVMDAVRSAGVTAIYREPEFDAAVLAAIGRATGVRILTLHSIYAGAVTDYPSLMRANASALVEGLAK